MMRPLRAVLGVVVACGLAATLIPSAQGASRASAAVASPALSTSVDTAFGTSESEDSRESLYHAVTTPVPFTDVRFVLPDRGRMFVSDADVVHVIDDQGAIERTITGAAGAEGMAVSADGATLYVAESELGYIAAVTVATGEITHTYTVASCPHELAVMGTTLFYTSGCSLSGWISHLDLATGIAAGLPDQVLTNSSALLTATTDTLIVADGQLRSWSIHAAEDGTPVFGVENSGPYFPHVLSLTSRDGNVVVIDASVNSYGIYRSDLGAIRAYPAVSYPTAIAWSHDGSKIVGGSDTPHGNGIRVFNADDANVTVAASIPSLAGRDGNQGVTPGAVMFSSDDSTVIALTREWTTQGWKYAIARASTTPASPSTVTLRVTAPSAFGRTSRVEVRSPGRPNSPILVTVTIPSRTWRASTSVLTNDAGIGIAQINVPFSGTLTAQLAGDLHHEAAPPVSASVRIPSGLAVTMGLPSRLVRGVVHYAKLSSMRQKVLLSPSVQSRMVRVTLQYLRGRSWVSTRPFTLFTDGHGYVSTAMKSARPRVLYRLVYNFDGDTWNSASAATSRVFTLG